MASKKSGKSKKSSSAEDPVAAFTELKRHQQAAKLKQAYSGLIKLAYKMGSEKKNFSFEVDKVVGDNMKATKFDKAEFDAIHAQADAFLAMLGRKQKSASRGGTSTLTAIILGDTLRKFFATESIRKYFIIREYKKSKGKDGKEEIIYSYDPFKNAEDLRLLLEEGLAFNQTVQNLFRAYNKNRKLPTLAISNQKIAKKKGNKELKGKKLEEKINKSYSGFDPEAKKLLAPILEKLGPYLKKTEPERKKAREEKTEGEETRSTKAKVKETETKINEGFDPDQFQSNPTWQSILKVGRKYDPTKKEDAVLGARPEGAPKGTTYSAAEPLSDEELARLREINTKKDKSETWRALLEQDEKTMTEGALKKREDKRKAAKKAKKGKKEEVEEEESEEEEEGEEEEEEEGEEEEEEEEESDEE